MTRALLTAFLVGLLHQTAWAQPGSPQPAQPPPVHQPQPQQPQPQQPQPQMVTPEEYDLLAQGEIPPELTVAGGLVGTFFGLGLGHAVQGRYGDIGWVFTVGEVGGVTVAMIGLAQCLDIDSDCDEAPALFWGGLLAFVGFRIGELVDVWAGPSRHNDKVRALRLRLGYPPPQQQWGLYLSPTKGGDGGKVMGVSWTF